MTSSPANRPVALDGIHHVLFRAKETLLHLGGREEEWIPTIGSVELWNPIRRGRKAIFATTVGTRTELYGPKLVEAGFNVRSREIVLAPTLTEAMSKAAVSLGVELSRCLVVDESASGIQAARSLGAGVVVGVRSGNTPEASLAEAHYVIDDLSAISTRNGTFVLASADLGKFGPPDPIPPMSLSLRHY